MALKKGSEQYNEILNRELLAFSSKFLQAIIEANKKVPRGTGVSSESFDIEVIKAGAGNLAELRLYFESGPRFYEYRKTNNPNGPPIELLKEWIESVGLGKFEKGFIKKNGQIPSNSKTFLNAVAWGIKKAKPVRKRRIRWYSKTHTYQYYRLMDQLSYAMMQAVVTEQKNILQHGKKN
jgi:hypothetical protein